ncbi:hypothetical protein GW17_00039005 [Ensete ventricosum]|nr:hypothetical protein GW17_00039005 [Ensete ventricosum]RZR84727.1 hypothetical protein BHM03_00011597 [Ensete ventricosum]
MGARWESTRSLLKVIGSLLRAHLELESSSGIGSGFGRCNGSSLGVRQEFAEGDREVTGSTPGVREKMIEKLVESSLEDAGKFARGCREVHREFGISIDMSDKNDYNYVLVCCSHIF